MVHRDQRRRLADPAGGAPFTEAVAELHLSLTDLTRKKISRVL